MYYLSLVVFYTFAGLIMVSGFNQALKDTEKSEISQEPQELSVVKEMKQQIKTLNDQFNKMQQELQDQVSKVVKENAEIQNKVSRVTGENKELREKVSKVVKENTEIQEKLYTLTEEFQKKVPNLTEENTELQNRVSRLTEENTELRQDLIELNDSMTVYISPDKHNTGFVSFTAYATETRDYNADDVVLFDGILNNYGGHYDPSISLFTCPYTGYYMFSVAFLADDDDNRMLVDIMMNNTQLVATWAEGSTGFSQASNMVVSLCDAGQTVWIRCHYYSGQKMYGSDTRMCTFTGTLLRIQ